LIELLVVIAVIGLLASIVLVSLGPARKKARDARRQADLKQISLAMEMCLDDSTCTNGLYLKTPAGGGNDVITQINTGGTPLYLKVPLDPLNQTVSGVVYKYYWVDNSVSPNEKYFCVYARSEMTTNLYYCASQNGTYSKVYPAAPYPGLTTCCI